MKSQRSEADLVEQAAKAPTRGDAAKITAELRKRFPTNQAGYRIGASAARDMRLFAEADAILAKAAKRFTDEAWVPVEQAALSQVRGDSGQARQRAAELRDRFPGSGAGYHIGASAARDLLLFDEASAILTEAQNRFGDQYWVLAELAALAQAGGEAERARQLAAELRNQFPDTGAGYRVGASAARDLRLLDEASAILTEAIDRFGGQSWAAAELATIAQAQGDAERSRRLAAELRNRFPGSEAGYRVGALAARDLRLFDEAGAILAEAADHFAGEVWVLGEQAWLAHARGDSEQARRLAAALRKRFPEIGAGYHVGACATLDLRLFDEASAILTEAVDRFGDQSWAASEQAALALARGEAEQARRLALDLRDRFPEDGAGYRVGVSAARELRLLDEASAILTEAEDRFGDQSWAVAEQAALAQARGEAEQARRLALDLRNRFPKIGAGYRIGASAARDLRLFDEAGKILTEAMDRFGDQSWTATEQATLAQARGHAEQARQLAADLRKRFPEIGAGYRIGASAARDLRLFDESDAVLAEAADRFAGESWVTAEQAWLAHARGHSEQAIELMAALRAREPDDPTGYTVAVGLLRGMHRAAESLAILEEARPRFSSETWFVRQVADISNLSNMAENRSDAERLIKTLSAEQSNSPLLARHQVQSFDKVVVIVGMHRAGTSLCTKIVKNLGFSLGGPLLRPLYDNPEGFQEHQEIHQTHEALLSCFGAAWDTSWLVRSSIDQRPQCGEVRALLDRLKSITVQELKTSGGRWAFKDPRTATFLPVWTAIFEELGIEPIWVLAVRDPRAVAASLYTRNRMPLAVGELLWVEHYLNALRYLGPRISAIIHYEKWFSPELNQLHELANILGPMSLTDINRASQSINDAFRHNKPEKNDTEIRLTSEVYSWLCDDYVRLGILQDRAGALWRRLKDHAHNAD